MSIKILRPIIYHYEVVIIIVVAVIIIIIINSIRYKFQMYRPSGVGPEKKRE